MVFFKVCPKCGSTRIREKIGRSQTMMFYCDECGYGMDSFMVFPEMDEKRLDDFRKKMPK
jgi:ribosomal protein L37AE/L43A